MNPAEFQTAEVILCTNLYLMSMAHPCSSLRLPKRESQCDHPINRNRNVHSNWHLPANFTHPSKKLITKIGSNLILNSRGLQVDA